MRVNQARNITSAGRGKAARRAARTGGFEPARGSAARRAPSTRGPAAVSSLDAIVALQTVENASERRSRAMRQGAEVLDSLEELKIAVLSGRVPAEKLARLSGLVQRFERLDTDPGLAETLREIDLRARVELAKLTAKKAS